MRQWLHPEVHKTTCADERLDLCQRPNLPSASGRRTNFPCKSSCARAPWCVRECKSLHPQGEDRTYHLGVRVAVYDSGIGGLHVLRACLLVCGDIDWVYIADEDFFPAGDRTAGAVEARLRDVASTLRSMGVDVVVSAASYAWPRLSAFNVDGLAVIDPVAEIGDAIDRVVHRRAMLGVLTPPSTMGAALVDRVVGGRPFRSQSSLQLAGVVERGGDRDELLVEVVRSSVSRFVDDRVSLVIPLDSHACMAADVVQRLSGGVPVLDTATHIATALEGVIGRDSSPTGDPAVTLMAPTAHLERVREAVVREVQLIPSVVPLVLASPDTTHKALT
jgi:glutamate racemase